jgi:hypothetical protein
MRQMARNTFRVVFKVLMLFDPTWELGKFFRLVDAFFVAVQALRRSLVDCRVGNLGITLDVVGQRAMAGLARQPLMLEFRHFVVLFGVTLLARLVSTVGERVLRPFDGGIAPVPVFVIPA